MRLGFPLRQGNIFPQDLVDAVPTRHPLEIEEPYQPARDSAHLLQFLVSVLREKDPIVQGKIVFYEPATSLVEA
jgi:hypothetical protein